MPSGVVAKDKIQEKIEKPEIPSKPDILHSTSKDRLHDNKNSKESKAAVAIKSMELSLTPTKDNKISKPPSPSPISKRRSSDIIIDKNDKASKLASKTEIQNVFEIIEPIELKNEMPEADPSVLYAICDDIVTNLSILNSVKKDTLKSTNKVLANFDNFSPFVLMGKSGDLIKQQQYFFVFTPDYFIDILVIGTKILFLCWNKF